MALLRKSKAKEVLGIQTSGLLGLEKAGHLHPIIDWAGHRRYDEEELERVREALRAGKLAPNPAKWDRIRTPVGTSAWRQSGPTFLTHPLS